ncbi:MAG: hypothetical protein IRZ08_15720 [Frankia sp.]|nr:hypothetical protein [Frankia sp.]
MRSTLGGVRARRARVATAALAGSLALAGCGLLGSDDEEPAASPAATTTPPAVAQPVETTTPAAAPPRAADYILTAANLTGFAPSGAPGDGLAPFGELAACLGISGTDVADGSTDRAESERLTSQASGVVVWSAAQVVPPAQLERDSGLLRHPRFQDCAAQAALADAVYDIESRYGAGSVLDNEVVTRETTVPAGALGRTSVVVLAGVAGAGQVERFYETIYLGSGQVAAQLHLAGEIEPPGEELVATAVSQLTQKLSQQ